MRLIAIWLSKQCVALNLIEEDLFEWCVYSFEKRITSILTWAFLMAIGFHFFGIIHSMVFILCFLLLRSCTNGYHASTYGGCLLLSIFVELICLTLAQLLPYIFTVVIVFLADIMILAYAPINDIKIHLDGAEIHALKQRIRIYLILLNSIYIILGLLQLSVSNCIAMALIADAISLSVKI